MARWLKIGGGVIAALVLLALIVPLLLPAEAYKAQVITAVKANTGRDLTIDGDVGLSIFPRFEVRAEQVRLSNAAWAKVPDMVTMSEMQVSLALWPLLFGEVKLDSFQLVDPVIALEVNAKGVANWQFTPPVAPGEHGDPGAPSSDARTATEAGTVSELRLGDVGIENGRASYRNAQSGADFTVEAINLDLTLADLDSPFEADGGVTWNGEPLDLALTVARPRALTSRESSPVDVRLSSTVLDLRYDGMARLLGGLSYDGKVDLSAPSVRRLMAWTGSPLPDGQGFGPLDIEGQVSGSDTKASFKEAVIGFDGMNATGGLSVDTSGARPALKGTLSVDRLDTRIYMANASGGATGGAAAPSPSSQSGTGAKQGAAYWSEAPINFSGLRAFDGSFSLQAGEILFRDLKIGQTVLALTLKRGVLDAKLRELALYEGRGTGELVFDGSGNRPSVKADFALSGLEALPFLSDAADFKRLTGKVAMELSLNSSGASQRALVGGLSGKGAVRFRDGALKGVNLAGLMRSVFASAISGWDAEGTRDTDFSELGGTFSISRGIATNNDFKMLGPLIRMTGAGTVDIPQRTLAYRVEPKLVASFEGQGAADPVGGIEVPVIIVGPWEKPRFRPDVQAVLQNTDQVRDTVRALKKVYKEKGAEDLLRGLFGVPKPAPEPSGP